MKKTIALLILFIVACIGNVYSQTTFREIEAEAKQGNSFYQTRLAEMYYNGEGINQNKEEAFKWYMKATKQGNSYAKFRVGVCLYFSEGEYDDGVFWIKEAADEGIAYAQFFLAYFYEEGKRGVIQSNQLAWEYYYKAAEQEYPVAEEALERVFLKGIGRKKDKKLAKYWLKRSEVSDKSWIEGRRLAYKYGELKQTYFNEGYSELFRW